MVGNFYREPQVPAPYSTNASVHIEYVCAHIEGFNTFMAHRGSQPERYVNGYTEEVIAADRAGYLAGVADAYDAWTQYSRTNAIEKR